MKKTRMGCLIKRGNVYIVQWRVNGKLFTRSTGKTTAKEAEAERQKIMAPFVGQNEVDALANIRARLTTKQEQLAALQEELHPGLPIGEAWAAFLASPTRPDTGKATLAKYEIQWGRFWQWIQEHYPDTKLMKNVTPEIAGQFAAWLTSEGRTPNTFNKYVNLLGLVFRTVKDKARLVDNPWDAITRKKLVTRGRRELTIEELRNVCAAAEGDLRLLLAVGLYSGLRLGDCATLRWSEVDTVRGRIVRIPNKTGRRSPKPVIIPLHPTLAAMLAEIPKTERSGYVLPRIATDYQRHASYVTDRVQALFKKCGIETLREVEGRTQAQVEVGFHSLRHSFVSMCAENNIPLAVVQALVGHTNPAMTRHYQHVGADATAAAVAALPVLMGDAKALPAPKTATMVDAAAVKALVDRLTKKNAMEIKTELTQLIEHAGTR